MSGSAAVASSAAAGDHAQGGGGRKENSSAVSTSASSQQQQPQYVTTTWFLRICKLLNIFTGLAGIVGVIANLTFLSVPFPAPMVALRIYCAILCVLSVLTEFEWARLFSWFGLLESWIGRGLFNIFCGILILVFEDSTGAPPTEGSTWIVMTIGGNALVFMGGIYVLGGLACLNRLKDRHMSKLRKRDQALVQKHELESKKHEIEMLLRDTESQLERI
jgi:hypothetical protein